MLSNTFKAAVKLSPKKSYQIAHAAGLHPSTLSKIISGIDRVKKGDPRVVKVARVLGLKPDECFALDSDETSLCREDTDAK